MSINELTKTTTELMELRRMREELDQEITALEDKIKAHMGDAEEVTAGAFKIVWKTITTSRFDSTRFKRDHADLAAAYTKTTTSRRFTVN